MKIDSFAPLRFTLLRSFDFLMSRAKVCSNMYIYIYMYVKIERERGNRGRRRNGSKGARRARFAKEWKRKRERCYDTRKKGSWRHSTTISRHSSFYSSRFTTLSFSSLLLPLLPIIALFARDTRSAFYPFDSCSSVARQWTTSDFEIITRKIF